jgi:hypothetical protein
MSRPASDLNNSKERWPLVPTPPEAPFNWPGRAFAYAMNSATELTGRAALTTRTIGTCARRTTPVRSLSGT